MKILTKFCLSIVVSLTILLIINYSSTNATVAVYEPFKPVSMVEFDTTKYNEWEDHLDTSWTYYGSIYYENSYNFKTKK